MNLQLQLALQVLLLPLVLSFVVWHAGLKSHRFNLLALFLIWVISFVWIKGMPAFPPAEAVEWVVLIGLLYAIISISFKSAVIPLLLNAAILLLGIVILTWPVLIRASDPQFFLELFLFASLGIIIPLLLKRASPSSPALTVGISNAGLAAISGLGGSLLIGQLAGVAASLLGAFILYELLSKLHNSELPPRSLNLMVNLHIWLALIARVYAEVALIPVVLVSLSLLFGLTVRWRYASVVSLLLSLGALGWLLATSDNSSYY